MPRVTISVGRRRAAIAAAFNAPRRIPIPEATRKPIQALDPPKPVWLVITITL